MSYKIIVARYNEDINWLNTEINNCLIYAGPWWLSGLER